MVQLRKFQAYDQTYGLHLCFLLPAHLSAHVKYMHSWTKGFKVSRQGTKRALKRGSLSLHEIFVFYTERKTR